MRKSFMSVGELYFFTATIHKWNHLLAGQPYKEIVLSSFRNLSGRGLPEVFAFVLMPNHLHAIVRTTGPNGKETVQGSFLRFTAHAFQRTLRAQNSSELNRFAVDAHNKRFEFWKRDSLAVPLFTRKVAFQKLDYIHQNPLTIHWNLAVDPCDYRWSSASFYETGVTEFEFLKDLRVEFDGV